MTRETYSTMGPKCPHCGRQFIADEPHYYDESNYTEETCDECGKKFQVSVETTSAWSCEEIEVDEDDIADPPDRAATGSPP
jgi:rRNA maturation protein Nop10